LTEVLRDEWKFDGYVVTDCTAIWFLGPFQQRYVVSPVKACALAINAGVDLECGTNYEKGWLLKAVQKKLVDESTIDRALRNVLRAYFDLGMFDPQEMVPFSKIPYSKVGCKEHNDLAYEVAVKSIVLLKNGTKEDGTKTLPLNKEKIKRVVVIGPHADRPIFGDYSGIPVNPAISPLDGIKNNFPNSEVIHVPWISPKDYGKFKEFSTRLLKPKQDCTKHTGLKLEIFNEVDFKGTPIILTEQNPTFDWNRRIIESISNAFVSSQTNPEELKNIPNQFSIRLSGIIEPDITTKYEFQYSTKKAKNPVLKIGDQTSVKGKLEINLEKGKSYPISIEIPSMTKKAKGFLKYKLPELETSSAKFSLEKRTIKEADVVLAFIGIDLNTEREGKDKDSLAFPKEQIDLIKSIKHLNKNIIGIVISGSNLELGYLTENLQALVQAWYPGERGGDAIADLLTGKVNFSGKLPLTFFKSTSQLPPISNYDLFKGRTYMYFDGEPQYEFGFGLSYTDFQYSNFKVQGKQFKPDDIIEYSIDIENTGQLDGEEIVQVYVKYEKAYGYQRAEMRFPNLQLKDFKRVKLNKGEKKTVQGKIAVNSIEFFEEPENKYVIIPGTLKIMVGKSSKQILFTETIEIVK